ncbi:TIR domain-containing protein [Sphingomonas donggukensis]|uniref:TIR domain-containing protein n=1 Tax=Sphingomonas donggukensis TaxID=2949093 RepID=A0ABY4TXP8_9SPHN|nr:TIR domain-containing protein [Sphingomonas donggukensis]URW75919.1 TIR domain-containing protein [Sphingomonas donggukensis]
MYNLFVSAGADAWNGQPWTIEIGRCVREYTDKDITAKFGELDAVAIAELKLLPCIFAYENGNNKNPNFGIITDVTRRAAQVRVEYELHPVAPFLTWQDMDTLAFELDLSKWEMNRTHWAVKNLNLQQELARARGIVLPAWVSGARKGVNLADHLFDVALSFPGESRPYVQQVAAALERLIGPDRYFYDHNYVAQLARPSLDTFLQAIYRDRSKLIVVFLGSDYERKEWCGIEFRAIREVLNGRAAERIMYVRMDDGAVEGVLGHDGFVDARRFSPEQLARFIHERAGLLP